jgi:hypothetical protein
MAGRGPPDADVLSLVRTTGGANGMVQQHRGAAVTGGIQDT